MTIEKLLFSMVITFIGQGILIAATTTLAAQADVDIRSTAASENIGYDRNVLIVANRNADPSAASAGKAYIRFQLPADFGSASSATFTMNRAILGSFAWTYSVYGLDQGTIPGSLWDELTWPEINTGTPDTATTWINAPGNVTDSSTAFSNASLLGTFVTKNAANGGVAGDQFSITGEGLVNFINADTNGFITFMVGRAGVSSSLDQWASSEHGTYTGPLLTLDYTEEPLDLKQLASDRWHAWRSNRTEFFTAAWQALYLYEGTADEYATYRDAGLNAVQSPMDDFEVSSSVGLDVLLGSWENLHVNHSKLASYVSYPSPDSTNVIGYILKDEPAANLFPDLAAATAYIYRYDKRGAIPIVDHLPNWAVGYDRFKLGNADGTYYNTYINKYVRDVSPCVMVNCHYPTLADGTDRTNFYENIEYFRHLALSNNIGLMGFPLVTAHTNGSGSVAYRQPSESDLNWMAYSYIAYGANGLFYYNYRFAQGGNYGEGLVSDAEGAPQPNYYVVKIINQELNYLWPVFKHLRSESVFHTGTNVPFGTLSHTNGASSAFKTFTADQFIIGTFTNQDSAENARYAVVVNKRHGANSSSAELNHLATFTAYESHPHVSMIDSATGDEITLSAADGNYAVAVGGGKGVLLKFRPFTTVENWAEAFGLNGADLDANADPDHDQASNLYEFAFGGNPTNSQSRGILPRGELFVNNGTTWLEYVYPRRTDLISGLNYELEMTSDLSSANWTPADSTEIGSALIDEHFESVTNRIEIEGNSHRFLRLRVKSQN